MVFRVQCVSQTWKSTIAQSLSIQERLFFRYQSKPQEVWAFSSVEDERGDTNSFCCRLNIWKDGRIPPQTFSGHPECSSYRYFRMSTFVTIDGVEMPYRLSPESANHRILLVAMNPTLAIPVTADNENYRRQRRSLFEPVVRGKLVDPPILWWNFDRSDLYQLASYKGTVANLEYIAAMYVCDPPCQKLGMNVRFFFEAIEESQTPTQVTAELRGIDVESSTGLIMADLLSAISNGVCKYHILAKQPPGFIIGDVYMVRGLEKTSGRQTSLAELQSIVQGWVQGKHMRMSPNIELDIRLVDSAGGLRPIVPKAEERSFVTNGWSSPAWTSTRHQAHGPLYDAFDPFMF